MPYVKQNDSPKHHEILKIQLKVGIFEWLQPFSLLIHDELVKIQVVKIQVGWVERPRSPTDYYPSPVGAKICEWIIPHNRPKKS